MESPDLVRRHAVQLFSRSYRRHDWRRCHFCRLRCPQRLGHIKNFSLPYPVPYNRHHRRLYYHEPPLFLLP